MATKYASAKYGSSSNGGTSFEDALLSARTAIAAGGNDSTTYVKDGKYIEENIVGTRGHAIGIGNVVFDGAVFNYFSSAAGKAFYNFNIRDYTYLSLSATPPIFSGCYIHNVGQGNVNGTAKFGTSVINTNKTFYLYLGSTFEYCKDTAIYGTSGNLILSRVATVSANDNLNVIIHSKPTQFTHQELCKVNYWHFYSVPIDITADALGSITYDGTAGKTIDDLRTRAFNRYGGAVSDYFPNCVIYDAASDDSFVDPTLGVKEGFYLKPNSPSVSANYVTGKHIGALPVARGLVFPTGFTYGSNIAIDGTLVDPNDNTPANNTLEYTAVFDHSKVILVDSWGSGIIQAERNGDIATVERDTDIDANLLGDTDTLTNDSIYVCETESLSVSAPIAGIVNLAVGENFTVPSTEVWTISATLGEMRELFPVKRPTVYVKFSRTNSTLTGLTYGENADGYLKFFIQAYDGLSAKTPYCLLDGSGIPILGDADTGFQYTGHPTYGDAVKVQLRYEKKKQIIQVENAKS
jgi:hypothetical protein